MLILDNSQIEKLLTPQQIINAVEQAMIAQENNIAIVPQRMHIDKGKNTLLCMPSWGSDYFGTKLVSVAPDNAIKNLPVTIGAMILNDGTTGMPLAVINASKLTALRTGAVGAIGMKVISPEKETSLGVIGCGIQGIHQAIFASEIWPINKIFLYDQVDSKISEAANALKKSNQEIGVIPCKSVEELATQTNIIVTATTSSTPVLPNDQQLLLNKHFVSIGSYKPSMQELPDAVYQLSGELYIDSEFARFETGDIINPIQKGFIKEENVHTIGKLIAGKRSLDKSKTTVYKSAGMALFDLYVAQALYEEAVKKKVGTIVPF